MHERLGVTKTYKLFIGGGFPRSESGRSIEVVSARGDTMAHVCRASRKDLRNSVDAAIKAQSGWARATAYLRGQILYRMAEMLEGRRAEFIEMNTSSDEVDAAVDRLVHYAGWADKYQQVLGCNNPVAGPYYNFTTPEPTGVCAVVAPDDAPLLGLVSLIAPPLCAGCSIVALAGESDPIPAPVFGEVCATSDVPPGVVNILTGTREELVPHVASHRGIDAVHAAGVSEEHATLLRTGASDNMKRVTVRTAQDWTGDDCESPWWIEPFVEMKTVWHPRSA